MIYAIHFQSSLSCNLALFLPFMCGWNNEIVVMHFSIQLILLATWPICLLHARALLKWFAQTLDIVLHRSILLCRHKSETSPSEETFYCHNLNASDE
jgi:hypothetical protein